MINAIEITEPGNVMGLTGEKGNLKWMVRKGLLRVVWKSE